MKLTNERLKEIVCEEIKRLVNEVKKVKSLAGEPKEVKAGAEADMLEKKIDFIKALGIKEVRLRKQLAEVIKQRKQLASRDK